MKWGMFPTMDAGEALRGGPAVVIRPGLSGRSTPGPGAFLTGDPAEFALRADVTRCTC